MQRRVIFKYLLSVVVLVFSHLNGFFFALAINSRFVRLCTVKMEIKFLCEGNILLVFANFFIKAYLQSIYKVEWGRKGEEGQGKDVHLLFYCIFSMF